MAFEPWSGSSDVFTKSLGKVLAPIPQRAPVSSPRQLFFENKLREIAWVLGGSSIPVHLEFQGEQRQLDKGCIGHAIANGVLKDPTPCEDGTISTVELKQ